MTGYVGCLGLLEPSELRAEDADRKGRLFGSELRYELCFDADNADYYSRFHYVTCIILWARNACFDCSKRPAMPNKLFVFTSKIQHVTGALTLLDSQRLA